MPANCYEIINVVNSNGSVMVKGRQVGTQQYTGEFKNELSTDICVLTPDEADEAANIITMRYGFQNLVDFRFFSQYSSFDISFRRAIFGIRDFIKELIIPILRSHNSVMTRGISRKMAERFLKGLIDRELVVKDGDEWKDNGIIKQIQDALSDDGQIETIKIDRKLKYPALYMIYTDENGTTIWGLTDRAGLLVKYREAFKECGFW